MLSGELGELGDSGLGDQGVMVREAEREMQPEMIVTLGGISRELIK